MRPYQGQIAMSAIVYSAARHVLVVGEVPVEHVHLALHLHRVAVDRVFDLHRRIGIEMAEAAAEIGRGSHLPEQPVHRLGARPDVRRQEGAEFLGQIEQDRAGFEQPDRLAAALRRVIHHRRDLGIRIDRDEAGAELVALADADQPGVVFGVRIAGGEQLLQHHRDLHPVRRALRIELQRVLADRQVLLELGAGGRPVGRGERAAILLVPCPHLRRHIAGGEVLFGREFGVVSHQIQSFLAGWVPPGFIERKRRIAAIDRAVLPS